MRNIQAFNELETQLHMVLDLLSNRERVPINESWIELAGEEFKASLRRQLVDNDPQAFRLRASNIGKPLCQLQMEKKTGTDPDRMDYNHITRMLTGDALESIVLLMLKAAGVNITGGKSKAQFSVNGTIIKGENDVEIDGKVWDVKSCSKWAFTNKWAEGWSGVYHHDSFGYVAQLYTYADGNPDKMGGWIVVNKDSGEVKVVPCEITPDQLDDLRENIHITERTITNDLPFRKQFEPVTETFYKKETGNLLMPIQCTFCAFSRDCWPDAVLKPKAMSKAQNPTPTWYVDFHEQPKETE